MSCTNAAFRLSWPEIAGSLPLSPLAIGGAGRETPHAAHLNREFLKTITFMMKSQLLFAALLGSPMLLPAQEGPAVAPEQREAPVPRPSGPVEVNGIAAKVSGGIVTKNEVNFLLMPIYRQLIAQFPRRGSEFDRQLRTARDQILDELIDREIILDESRQLGASLKPTIIDEEVKRQIRENYNGDEPRFRDELKKNRLTMDGYREMTREKLIVQAIKAQHYSESPPPLPNEIQKEYDSVKTLMRDTSKDAVSYQKIFIPRVDPNLALSTPETQLAKTEDIFKQLQEGKDFTELAKANSQDAFAAAGGVQENVPRTDLSPEFAAIIFNSEPGKLLGPLEDPTGFTIVKVTKKDLGPPPPLSKVREVIEERVRKKKTAASYERWIERKRKQAIIDRRI